jgi:signal transduction histidine kinase
MPMLRLSHKLFLAFALIVGVVLALAGWSHLATRQLSEENQVIINGVVPAIRLEVTILEGIAALRRVEARHIVLRDPTYVRLFAERADAIGRDLALLHTMVSTAAERQTLEDVTTQLQRYRALAERPIRLAAGTESAARQLEDRLQHLFVQSSTELRRRGTVARALEAQSRRVALIAIGASLAVVIGVGVFTSLRIARPLRRLHAAVRAVGQRALAEAIPARGRDEIAELSRAFNLMAAQLRELDELKQRLFSAITHDLRTPLTVIRWSAERLGGGAPNIPAERQVALVENIRVNTIQLLSLVTQLLDLGKLKSGKLQLELDRTDIAGLIQEAVSEIRPWAEDRRLRVALTVPDSLPKLWIDAKRIHQVMVNLLANAVKFSQAAGLITVTAVATDDHVMVAISDTGIGIPKSIQATIFEQYEQAHKDRGGTGLGLTIVKAFVTAHGGRVWVESEAGHGSRFTFTLPLEGPSL